MATRLITKTTPLNTNELKYFSLLPSILTELCGKHLEKYEDLFILFSFLSRLRKNRIELLQLQLQLKAEISYSIEKYNLCSCDQ